MLLTIFFYYVDLNLGTGPSCDYAFF